MSEEVGGLWGGSWLEGADIRLKPPAFIEVTENPRINRDSSCVWGPCWGLAISGNHQFKFF